MIRRILLPAALLAVLLLTACSRSADRCGARPVQEPDANGADPAAGPGLEQETPRGAESDADAHPAGETPDPARVEDRDLGPGAEDEQLGR